MFRPSPAQYPELRKDPQDPRFLELATWDPAQAQWMLCGVPFDGAVLGRKGAAGGPVAVREAMRFLATHDPERDVDLAGFRWHDVGDLADCSGETLAVHERLRQALSAPVAARKPLVVVGGDNSLTFPTFQALHDTYGGRWGVLVLDAHYDVRPWSGQPSSGTPYGRILSELPKKPVSPDNMVHVGIRPLANTGQLARRARELGLEPFTVHDVEADGVEAVLDDALGRATDGVDHLFLSVDMDVLDQSVAPGVSAPGIGGLLLRDVADAVFEAALDPACRGMDLVETAPALDPTGNTTRCAAFLVAQFALGLKARELETN